jgi:dephospho-CoA kinase
LVTPVRPNGSSMKAVLAFAGKIGSGKTALTTALAHKLGCKRASFGDYVRHVVNSRGLRETRETLQRVGTELLEEDMYRFCGAVLRHAGWIPGETLMLDGLRHAETIDPLQRLVHPLALKIVYLEIDDETRLRRLGLRGGGDRATLSSAERHSSELQVATKLAVEADLVINGVDTIESNVCRVLDWMEHR